MLEAITAHKQAELERDRASRPLVELQAAAQDAPAPRPFAQAIRRGQAIRLIAEVKRASPSRGVIRPDFDPADIARQYAAARVDALSVLTDATYFMGRLDHLSAARKSAALPVLRKDFTLDPYHVWQARAAGADAVLLIAAILSDGLLRELSELAARLGMAALVEVHDEQELERALAAEAEIIGINNRDLRTFHTSLGTTLRLRPGIPDGRVVVSESGIQSRADVRQLEAARVDAMLVGEALMRSRDIGATIAALTGRPPTDADSRESVRHHEH
jgi:indole-3-glycerol phosphate synthase